VPPLLGYHIGSISRTIHHQKHDIAFTDIGRNLVPNMSECYIKAIQSIDEAHARDPRNFMVNDLDVPYELYYARKITNFLDLHCPDATEPLRIAVRAQHLRRWEVPRASYPMTRAGYYSWRTFLKNRQANQARQICVEAGLTNEDADRVASLIRKENLKNDEESQILEDVACLVFLDDQFEEFKNGYDEEKIVNILKKTWVKMSQRGHDLALKIPMSDEAKALISKAVLSGNMDN
jgi:Domain of unknown function (DUF4202)